MPIVCPACNKATQTEAACQRCGCDLSRLHDIAAAADSRLSAAHAALAAREWPAALTEAERAWRLVHGGEAARLAFLAAVAAGDTARAVRWRQRVAEMEKS